jgi:hypothetical protein
MLPARPTLAGCTNPGGIHMTDNTEDIEAEIADHRDRERRHRSTACSDGMCGGCWSCLGEDGTIASQEDE